MFFSMSFSIQISILFASNFFKDEKGGCAVEAVIYGCIRGLGGRIPDCNLGMHVKCFHEIQKASFLILVAGSLQETMDLTGSKAIAITASTICVFTQMVYGGRRKSIATKKTLVTIQMGVSFD